MSSNLHEPRTKIERRSQRQLWIVTLIIVVVILVIAICFFALRHTSLGPGPVR
jgi:predicted ABC-type sugar transport system permease subunit